ncbi:MAG: dihydropteroate synthase, partial [Sediminibacterium sp.]|nr:dihydropteroate synthase [Sediminibacterium sp.]
MNHKTVENSTKNSGIKIMGIINVTPDSFYDESRVATAQLAFDKAIQFVNEGVDIIDIGGLSSRPNATLISEAEEINKVIPAIQLIHQHFPQIPISIDSFRAKVVQQALEAGATIVNDISGGNFDENLLQVVAKNNAPYICMHVMGNFNTMHSTKLEGNIMPHILEYFTKKNRVLHNMGIKNII